MSNHRKKAILAIALGSLFLGVGLIAYALHADQAAIDAQNAAQLGLGALWFWALAGYWAETRGLHGTKLHWTRPARAAWSIMSYRRSIKA